MINPDFLIPTPADCLHIGDKLYLPAERSGKLFVCISVNPIVVSDSYTNTEWTLDASETVYVQDAIIQFVNEYLHYCEQDPDYVELNRLVAVLTASDVMEQFSPEAIEGMHNKVRYLYNRLFLRARSAAFH